MKGGISMKKILVLLLILFLSLPSICGAETSASKMTQEQRDNLLLEILQANAAVLGGEKGNIREFDSISKDTPVYLGETAHFLLTKSGFDVEMTLKDITYGKKANKLVEDANMFNDVPGDDQEYIVATFFIQVSGGTDSLSINEFDFDFVSRSGAVYKNSPLISGLESEAELYSGAYDEIQIPWLIDSGDIPYALYAGGVWFDLTPEK
jgi:hypothetical protein